MSGSKIIGKNRLVRVEGLEPGTWAELAPALGAPTSVTNALDAENRRNCARQNKLTGNGDNYRLSECD